MQIHFYVCTLELDCDTVFQTADFAFESRISKYEKELLILDQIGSSKKRELIGHRCSSQFIKCFTFMSKSFFSKIAANHSFVVPFGKMMTQSNTLLYNPTDFLQCQAIIYSIYMYICRYKKGLFHFV